MRDAATSVSEPSIDIRLFDSATDLMCVRDMQGRLVRVNRAWESTLGLSIDEVQNAPLLPLVHPADVPLTLLHMSEADHGRQVIDFVNRYRHRDGRYRHIQWRAQRMGNVILGRARDVTALRDRDDRLRVARQTLEETLADIASQIKAPSDEILMTVQALGQTALTEAQRTILQVLGRSVQTLDGLVSQMIERERETAWATFLPAIERQGLASVPRRDKYAELTPTPDVARQRPSAQPSTLGGQLSGLEDWIAETSRHVDLNPNFYRTLRDLSSRTLGLLAIRLDHLGQLYPRRLENLSAGAGLMGDGRVAALLARMQGTGFVDIASQTGSGQVRVYHVLPTMTHAYAGLLHINLQSLATSDYRAVLALEAIEADGQRAIPLLAAFAAALLDDVHSGTIALGNRLNGVPAMARGQDIALAIGADAGQKHGSTWEGWVEITLTSYARRFAVSRVHVSRVIDGLEPCGLLRDPASPSRLLVTNRFRLEIDGYRQAMCHLLAGVLERLV